MPIYTTRDKETGEVTDIVLKMSEKEKYLEDHPNLEFIITQAPSLGDAIRLGLKKPDNAWKEVLQKIDSRVPGSKLKENSRYM